MSEREQRIIELIHSKSRPNNRMAIKLMKAFEKMMLNSNAQNVLTEDINRIGHGK